MLSTQPAPVERAQAWHCPHCGGYLAVSPSVEPGPPSAMRCPGCRLLVAARRGITSAAAADVASTGVAAGTMAGAARRATGRTMAEDDIFQRLRQAAEVLGVPVARMRMVDFDVLAQRGEVDLHVADVLTNQPSWKHACRAADRGVAAVAPPPSDGVAA